MNNKKWRIVNIESGMPTVSEAEQRMSLELAKARREGVSGLKIIHGYGSTGVGGKLREAMRKWLARRQREGKVKCFVAGENWSIFDENSREILEKNPDIRRDADLGNCNAGITIVML